MAALPINPVLLTRLSPIVDKFGAGVCVFSYLIRHCTPIAKGVYRASISLINPLDRMQNKLGFTLAADNTL